MKFKNLSKMISESFPEYKGKVSLKICSGYANNVLIMFQPSTTLTYSRENGIGVCNNEDFCNKIDSFMGYATDKADLLLVPEGCFPWGSLNKILDNKQKWPRDKALWCLCMQGISKKEFERIIKIIRQKENILIPSIDDLFEDDANKAHVNLLFYLFKSDNNEKLFVIPQAKLGYMRDNDYLNEGNDLYTGTTTYIVDLVEPEHHNFNKILITAICADTFYLEYNEMKNLCENQDLILLHPQCCTNPLSPDFCRLQDEALVTFKARVQYIALNWAEGTSFDRHHKITTPMSMIKCGNNVDNTDNSLDSFRSKIANNQKNNLPFFYDTYRHCAEWCLYTFEQIIKIEISNTGLLSSDGSIHGYNPPTAIEVKYFLNGSLQPYNKCHLSIANDLSGENVNDFLPQIQVCDGMINGTCNVMGNCQVCQLDDFFGRCFGNRDWLEEIKYSGLHKRLVTSVYNGRSLDEDRNEKIILFETLCELLKTKLPEQVGKHKKVKFYVCDEKNHIIKNACIGNKYYVAAICNINAKEAEKLYNNMCDNYYDNIILYYHADNGYVPFEKDQLNTSTTLGPVNRLRGNGVRTTSIFETLSECIEKLFRQNKIKLAARRDLNEH